MARTAVKEKTVGDILAENPVPQEAPASNLPAIAAPQQVASRAPAPPPHSEPKHFAGSIAKAILAVAKEIGVIQKGGFNEFQRYKFTRWEDINDKLSPLLAEHGLILHQSEKSRNLLEENDKGSVLAIVYDFTIINERGDQWPPTEVTAIARLRDQKGITDDKAALKCHTQAEKTFCVKQFKIRSDEHTIEGENRPQRVADERVTYQKFLDEIKPIDSLVELDQWKAKNLDRVRGSLRDTWLGYFNIAFKEKRADLEGLMEYVDQETGEIQTPAATQTPTPPSPASSPAAAAPPSSPIEGGNSFEEVAKLAREAAKGGLAAYAAWWGTRSKSEQAFLDTMSGELDAILRRPGR